MKYSSCYSDIGPHSPTPPHPNCHPHCTLQQMYKLDHLTLARQYHFLHNPKNLNYNDNYCRFTGRSTLIENSPHHPKVKGLNIAATADTRRKNTIEKIKLN
jgi:hypothetical protein